MGLPVALDRKTIFIGVTTLAALVTAYALFVRGGGEAVRSRGSKLTTVMLENSASAGQSFKARSDGLDSIELQIGPMDVPLNTDVRCELLQADGGAYRSIYRWLEHVEMPASGGAHRFSFAPVVKSKDEVFRFVVRLDRPGSKIPIEASVDNPYDGGAMIVNDQEQWGDLTFETGALASTTFGQFRMIATALPGFLRLPIVQVVVLVAFAWAWLSLVYWLFVAQPDVS